MALVEGSGMAVSEALSRTQVALLFAAVELEPPRKTAIPGSKVPPVLAVLTAVTDASEVLGEATVATEDRRYPAWNCSNLLSR